MTREYKSLYALGVSFSLLLSACENSGNSSSDSQRPKQIVIVGSATFVPSSGDASGSFSTYQPLLATRIQNSVSAPAGFYLESTGGVGALTQMCQVSKIIRRFRSEGEIPTSFPDLALMIRSPSEIERSACADSGADLVILQIAEYKGIARGLGTPKGAWLVYDRSTLRPSAQTVIDYIITNRRALFETGPYATDFDAII